MEGGGNQLLCSSLGVEKDLEQNWLRGGFPGADSLPPVCCLHSAFLFSPCEEEVQAKPHPATQMGPKCLSQHPRKGARPDLRETKRKK